MYVAGKNVIESAAVKEIPTLDLLHKCSQPKKHLQMKKTTTENDRSEFCLIRCHCLNACTVTVLVQQIMIKRA